MTAIEYGIAMEQYSDELPVVNNDKKLNIFNSRFDALALSASTYL